MRYGTIWKRIAAVLLAAALCLVAGCASRTATEPPKATPFVTVLPVVTVTPAPTDTPMPTETPAPEREALTRARTLVAAMTDEEKVYQLFIVSPEAVTGTTGATTMATETGTKAPLAAHPVGGFVYAAANLQYAAQAAAMISGQQSFSAVPLLTCVDEEGGRVSRLLGITGTLRAMYSYRNDGTETAFANAAALARNLRSLGLNTDFAPVADVWSNPDNTVIGDRAYSDDFETAAALVAAAVAGFQEENIICTLKHFPGHGDTAEDSHYASAVVHRTPEELREREFLPFLAGIEAGADMVMVGHLTVPALDGDTPATFSRAIVTDLLRDELGFEGVVITDALNMASATAVSSGGEACVLALTAGCDLLLGAADTPAELEAAVRAVLDELETPGGRLDWDGVDTSVARVLAMKIEHGLL